jgi:hypothetical protein
MGAHEAEKRLPELIEEFFQVVKRHDIIRDDKAKNGFKGIICEVDP